MPAAVEQIRQSAEADRNMNNTIGKLRAAVRQTQGQVGTRHRSLTVPHKFWGIVADIKQDDSPLVTAHQNASLQSLASMAHILAFYLAFYLAFHLAFYLAYLVTFYLAYFMALFLALYLAMYLACVLAWHVAYILWGILFALCHYVFIEALLHLRLLPLSVHIHRWCMVMWQSLCDAASVLLSPSLSFSLSLSLSCCLRQAWHKV